MFKTYFALLPKTNLDFGKSSVIIQVEETFTYF